MATITHHSQCSCDGIWWKHIDLNHDADLDVECITKDSKHSVHELLYYQQTIKQLRCVSGLVRLGATDLSISIIRTCPVQDSWLHCSDEIWCLYLTSTHRNDYIFTPSRLLEVLKDYGLDLYAVGNDFQMVLYYLWLSTRPNSAA